MLFQRRRRWADIVQMLCKGFVFAGNIRYLGSNYYVVNLPILRIELRQPSTLEMTKANLAQYISFTVKDNPIAYDHLYISCILDDS